MSEAPNTHLLVIDDFTAAAVMVDAASAWLTSHPGGIVIGALPALKERSPGRVFSWSELRNVADCHQENFAEFTGLSHSAAGLLAAGSCLEDAEPIRSLVYGFSSPHSEDLPFFISGLTVFFSTHAVARVTSWRVSRTGLAALAGEVATLRRIPVREELPARFWFASVIHRAKNALKAMIVPLRHWQLLVRCSGAQLWSNASELDVLFPLNKERSLRYLNPILLEAQKAGLRFGVLVHPDIAKELNPGCGLERANFPRYMAIANAHRFLTFALLAVMRNFFRRRRIAALPQTYRGVRVAPYHASFLSAIFLGRGPSAALAATQQDQVFARFKPRSVLVIDPLEGSYLAIQRANRSQARTIFFYSIYNGWASTAAIWEDCALPCQTVLTINEWMAERTVAKKLSSRNEVKVVGDVLRSASGLLSRAGTRRELASQFGLDSEKNWVVVLTRAVSSALSWEEKQALLTEGARVAAAVSGCLIVKGHPYENREVLATEVHSCQVTAALIVTSEAELQKWVIAADLVISSPSSAAVLDALYAQTPAFIYGPRSLFEHLDAVGGPLAYRRGGAGEVFYLGESMVERAKVLLSDARAREESVTRGLKFAAEIVGDTDGRAAERIVGVLTAFS